MTRAASRLQIETYVDIVRIEFEPARCTGQAATQFFVADMVTKDDARSESGRKPAAAPIMQRDRERKQIATLFGEFVFVSRRLERIELLLDHAGGEQFSQSIREHVSGDAERLADVVVAAQSEEQCSDQQCCPTVTDGVDGVEQRRIDPGTEVLCGRRLATSHGASLRKRMFGGWPGFIADFFELDRRAAFAAGQDRLDAVPTNSVDDPRWQTKFGAPAIFPTPHAERDGIYCEAFFGQAIFEPFARGAIETFIYDTVGDEVVEACGQRAAGSAGSAPELFEAAHTEKRVAQNQQRPSVADDIQGPRRLAGQQNRTYGA